jgi:DNA-directed RNA polymerase subunit alpha
MNIRTLGDLMKMTEPELLAHKNFGETSLLEVKQMLAQKGLRLAQHRGQTGGFIGQVRDTAPTIVDKEDVLKKPISELQLSVRSRNCMSRLQMGSDGN